MSFTNMEAQIVGEQDGGGHRVVGSQGASLQLRMIYGASDMLIATFRTGAEACRWAMACNAALSRNVSPAGYGAVVVATLESARPRGDVIIAGRHATPGRHPLMAKVILVVFFMAVVLTASFFRSVVAAILDVHKGFLGEAIRQHSTNPRFETGLVLAMLAVMILTMVYTALSWAIAPRREGSWWPLIIFLCAIVVAVATEVMVTPH